MLSVWDLKWPLVYVRDRDPCIYFFPWSSYCMITHVTIGIDSCSRIVDRLSVSRMLQSKDRIAKFIFHNWGMFTHEAVWNIFQQAFLKAHVLESLVMEWNFSCIVLPNSCYHKSGVSDCSMSLEMVHDAFANHRTQQQVSSSRTLHAFIPFLLASISCFTWTPQHEPVSWAANNAITNETLGSWDLDCLVVTSQGASAGGFFF